MVNFSFLPGHVLATVSNMITYPEWVILSNILNFKMQKERQILPALPLGEQIFQSLICPSEIISTVNYLNLAWLGFLRKDSCLHCPEVSTKVNEMGCVCP